MKPNLLDDVIHEGDYPAFRDELAARFQHEVRRTQTRRRLSWLAMAASIALLASIIFYPRSTRESANLIVEREAVPTIRTTPLKSDKILVTTSSNVRIVQTTPGTFLTISTKANSEVQAISDSELFDLFPEHPTALMAANGGKRFIFIDPADARKFMTSN